MSDMQDFTDYFQNVLGVRQILLLIANQGSGSQSQTLPQVFVEGYSSYSDFERDLLDKVLSAVGLSLEMCSVTDSPDQLNNSILIFQNDSSQASSKVANEFPSPRIMVSNPSLKKQCWQKLQTWMKTNSL